VRWTAIAVAALLAACNSTKKDVRRFVDAAMADPGPATSQQVLDEIEKVWGDVMSKRTRVPRGQRSRYAYHAWQVGRREQARQVLAVERAMYPEAARFLDALLEHLQREEGT